MYSRFKYAILTFTDIEMRYIKLKKIHNKLIILIGVLLIFVLSYLFIPSFSKLINDFILLLSSLDVGRIKEYILSFGIWAPIISFLLMIFQSIAAPLPAFVITFANAGLFGWIKGGLLSWSSAMVGATLCFYIGRILGRDAVVKLTSNAGLKQVDDFFDRYGKFAILIARLLPFISFDIVSYGAGLTSMSFWSFFWATGIGQLPATIIYSYVGEKLTGSLKWLVTGLMLVFAVSILIYMIKQFRSDKNKDE